MADSHGSGLDAGREALRRFLAGDDDLKSMLSKITMIATEIIPGVDAASITMIASSQPKTPAYSDKVAFELDQVQYDLGDGPCLAAIRHQGVELMTTDPPSEQWPTLSDAARDRGVLAVLSAPLIDRDTAKGALNLYSESGFDREAWEVASLFADQLGIAAVNATLHVEGSLLADQLRCAMESRAVIEQAKGILMRAEHCGPDAAFEILVSASQHRNLKLREIAAELVQKYTSGGPSVSAQSDGDGAAAQG